MQVHKRSADEENIEITADEDIESFVKIVFRRKERDFFEL